MQKLARSIPGRVLWYVVLLAAGVALVAGEVSSSQAAGIYVWTNFVGEPGGAGNVDGMGGEARFSHPSAVTVDSRSNVYVPDSGNCTIRQVMPVVVITTVGGTPDEAGRKCNSDL
jgi:hypothetical protein